MKFTALPTGSRLSKALNYALDERCVLYTAGLYDDPHQDSQTAFHFFDPGEATTCTLLFHGTGNDALFCWEDWILDLVESGRAVLAFDLPGHGQNSSTILSEESFANCGRFVPELLAELLPTLQSMDAIGYSLGAWAALLMHQQQHVQWERLVLMALPEKASLTPAFFLEEARSFFRNIFWQEVVRYGWAARFPAFGPWGRQRFPLRLASGLNRNYAEFVAGLLTQAPITEVLENLSIPLLLVYGGRDYLAKPGSRHQFVMEGVNHFLLPLHEPTRREVRRWLLNSPQHPAAN